MSVQGINAMNAGLTLTGLTTPHSDGLEPPPKTADKRASAPDDGIGAQRNAADGGVEASDPRRVSEHDLDVIA